MGTAGSWWSQIPIATSAAIGLQSLVAVYNRRLVAIEGDSPLLVERVLLSELDEFLSRLRDRFPPAAGALQPCAVRSPTTQGRRRHAASLPRRTQAGLAPPPPAKQGQ